MSSGFGSDSLGSSTFGNASWAESILWNLVSEANQLQDYLSGGILNKISYGIQPEFDKLKDKIQKLSDLRDPFTIRTDNTEVNYITLGKPVELLGALVQHGSDGLINGLGEFTSKSIRLFSGMIGYYIYIYNSDIEKNNTKVSIIAIQDKNTALISEYLGTTTTKFRWELRLPPASDSENTLFEIRSGDLFGVGSGWSFEDGFNTLSIRNRFMFLDKNSKNIKTLLEKQTSSAEIDSSGRIKCPALKISDADIGKIVSINGSIYSQNNIRAEIVDIDTVSPTDRRIVISRVCAHGADLNSTVYYTMVQGNAPVKVRHIIQAGGSALTLTLDDEYLTVALETDAGGNIITTALQLQTAIQNDPIISEIISISYSGTGAGYLSVFDSLVTLKPALKFDASSIYVGVAPFQIIQLNSAIIPRGVIEKEGRDGVISSNIFSDENVNFTQLDVGKVLTIHSQIKENNRTVEILAVNSTQVTIDIALTSEAGPLKWELSSRCKTDLQGRRVKIYAPGFIGYFAREFGLEIDNQDSELRQRNFAAHLNQWIDKKGTNEAYSIIGKISGYDIEATQLYRVSRSLAINPLLSDDLIITGSGIATKSGTDGRILPTGDGDFYFETDSGKFETTDIGSCIKIANAISLPQPIFTIKSLISDRKVKLKNGEGAAPDTNNGSLQWNTVKIYSKKAPLLPNFDEINFDLMTEIVGASAFTVDKFCFEEDFLCEVEGTVDGDSTKTKFTERNIVQVTAEIEGAVVVAVGNWYLEDLNGTQFYLETVPQETTIGSGIYTFTVFSSALPVAGACKLKYSCPVNAFCFYCPSSKIYLFIETGSINDDTDKQKENSFFRLLNRLNLVKPIHVEFIPALATTIDVTIDISVDIVEFLSSGEEIFVGLSTYFDILPADIIPVDYIDMIVEIET